MKQLGNLMATALSLIALYLVLRFGANATKVISSLARGTATVFTTLQGRPVRGL